MGSLKSAGSKVMDTVLKMQRLTFLKAMPFRKLAAGIGVEVKDSDANAWRTQIESEADALVERHTPELPEDCERAATHLQLVSLGLAGYRVLGKQLRSEGASSEELVRCVGAGFGVLLQEDALTPVNQNGSMVSPARARRRRRRQTAVAPFGPEAQGRGLP